MGRRYSSSYSYSYSYSYRHGTFITLHAACGRESTCNVEMIFIRAIGVKLPLVVVVLEQWCYYVIKYH